MKMENPLKSLKGYSLFVSTTLDKPHIKRSTVVVWSDSPFSGTAEGDVLFREDFRLRMREELDFEDGLITAYGYEVYKGEERLFWYDDFPHPHDETLASTFPHHKHIPPDIKRHRIPAPLLSFSRPNLPVIIKEVEDLMSQRSSN